MTGLFLLSQNISFECLEQALVDCPCGLLLVSHDRRFLDALAHKRWHISEDSAVTGEYILEIQWKQNFLQHL